MNCETLCMYKSDHREQFGQIHPAKTRNALGEKRRIGNIEDEKFKRYNLEIEVNIA